MKLMLLLTILAVLAGCASAPAAGLLRAQGRVDMRDPSAPVLVGPGSFLEARFRGGSCVAVLELDPSSASHCHVVAAVDGQAIGRWRVGPGITRIELPAPPGGGEHTVTLCLATEAANGAVRVLGVEAQRQLSPPPAPSRLVEFIGDSITCGFGNDESALPCGEGEWHDQHNAWLAFGPVACRELDADWVLSAVSGIGVTRNWNTPGPVIGDVIDKLALRPDGELPWNGPAREPDVLVICLGTNDHSDGDGSSPREPLDEPAFEAAYASLVARLRARSPSAAIVLLGSPLLSGEKARSLDASIGRVAARLREEDPAARVVVHSFGRSWNGGCTGHPSAHDHAEIASEVVPILREVAGW